MSKNPTHYTGTLETSGTGGRGSKTSIHDVVDIYPSPEAPAVPEVEVDPDAVLVPGARSANQAEGSVLDAEAPDREALLPGDARGLGLPAERTVETVEDDEGDEAAEAADDGDWYDDDGVTNAQLSDELDRRGLAKTGAKAELIARLRESDAASE